jgi:hypothetical protein
MSAVREEKKSSGQEVALTQCKAFALEAGIDLLRKSSCYPPLCKMHDHSQKEKLSFGVYAGLIAQHSDHTSKPKE